MAIAYVCVFPSLIAYFCFNRGVELLGSATAGLYMNIMPILGSALAALFLGEAIRQFHIVGGILIGAGIFLASIRKAAPKSNLFASSDSQPG